MPDKDRQKDKSKKPKVKSKKVDQELNKRVDELECQLKQALADYHNLSKRVEERQRSWRDRAASRIIDKILDVYDDLTRAEKELNDKGLSMAVDQFWSVLGSEGVEKVRAEEKEFDADLMDCVKMVDGCQNQVINIIRPGYLLNGEVIRPAKVTVGKGSAERNKKENKDE